MLIVNPNHLHSQFAIPAAEAGKAVLVEKPMTNTVAEGKVMIAAFKKRGVLLGVKHLHRFSPESRKVKELIETGVLGQVLSVEVYTSHSTSKTFPKDRWKRDAELCPAAPLTQLAVHYIDTAMSFFGAPAWVQSHHRNVLKLSENVDCTVTLIGYGEVVGAFTAHYVVPGYSRMAVYGNRGRGGVGRRGLRLKREGQPAFEAVKPSPPAADSLRSSTPSAIRSSPASPLRSPARQPPGGGRRRGRHQVRRRGRAHGANRRSDVTR